MAFASIAAAQTVWTVPPGQPVGPTIAAASPGDIIQLSGTHPVFDLDKGLTVRGPATIEPSATLPAPIETSVDIPAGQVASFEQLVFQASYNSSGGHGGRVVVDGELSCEDCSFDAVTGQLQGTVELRTGVLALQRCDLQGVGGGAGLAILGGTCSAVDCTFAGASDGFWWPAPAIDVRGGVLMAAGITATGGYGGSLNGAFLPGQAGLRRTAGRAVVVDSELRGGVTFGPGGPAIAATTGVTIARTVLVDAALSPPSSGFTVDPDLPGIEISGPLATGATTTITAAPGAADVALLLVGSLQLAATQIPAMVEPLFGAPSQHIVIAAAVPPQGQPLATNFTVPNVPGLAGLDVWFQAIEWTPSGLRGSATVGGSIR